MSSFVSDLEALRQGGLGFDDFATRHRDRFQRWAGYFFERWPQSALDRDDLVQEALLEAWRAVDRFDSERGPSLEKWVEYRVGSAMRNALDKVRGWPRRGKIAIKSLSLSTPKVDLEAREKLRTPPDAEDRLELADALRGVDPGLVKDTLVGLGLGMNHRIVAAHIYADPDRRAAYRFGSQDEAVKRVRAVVREAAKGASVHF